VTRQFAIRVPAGGAKYFSVFQNTQVGFGAHPASCSVGTGGLYGGQAFGA